MTTQLVVEPDGQIPGRWRFGRVTGADAPLGAVTGALEERDGGFHLLSGHPESITALLLVARHGGPPRRLIHDPAAVGASLPSTPRQRVL